MKKKMLFMAALAGMVTLGSCVKDDVSGSVEAVRMAKANQLNADAADKNAHALVNQSQAALNNAQIAVTNATAALTQANADIAKLNAQLKAATYEAELASKLADFENQTATSKSQAQFALNNLAQYVRDAALDKYTDVTNAIGDFNLALLAYTQAEKDVIAAKLRLAAAQNDAEHVTEIKDQAIAAWEKEIKDQEKMIEELSKVEAEGVSVAEAKAEIAKLRAEINNAMYNFAGSAEVKAMEEASLALRAAHKDYSDAKNKSYTNVNNMVADALGTEYLPGTTFVYDYATDTWGLNTASVWVPAGGYRWTAPGAPGDYINAANRVVQLTPWGGTYTGYYQEIGSTEIIASDLVKYALPWSGFRDATGYRYTYTADLYDEHGCLVGGICEATGVAAVADGVNDSNANLVDDGSVRLGGVWTIYADQYRVNELTKNAADTYFKEFPANAQKALNAEKNKLALLKAKMGTDKDAKDTKYKDANGKEQLTDYAVKKAADERVTKANNAVTTAEANISGKPAAVKKALEALVAENNKKSFDGDKWIAAVVDLAAAVEEAYGSPKYDPNIKKFNYATVAHRQAAVDYLIGKTGVQTPAWMQDPDNVKLLFKNGDAACIVTGWASDADKKDDTEADKVTAVGNRSTAKDAKKNVFDVLSDAKKEQTAAKAAAKAANEAILGTFNSDNQLIVKGTTQLIAESNDKIAKYERDLANAGTVKANYENAIKATDVNAYDKAVKALSEAAQKYNEAAQNFYVAHYQNIDAKNDQITALVEVVKQQDIESQILAAKKRIADAKKNIANWENVETTPGAGDFDNNAAAIIAQAEIDLKEAEANLALAAANLVAAQSELEALVGEIDFDIDGEDEPETPAEGGETPAEGGETPAEGGETPAEGGETPAEGGEEA